MTGIFEKRFSMLINQFNDFYSMGDENRAVCARAAIALALVLPCEK
jgi:hypothetical protein